MAQALFDDHPIEHYLRESGEMFEPMPGGLEEFSRAPPNDDVLDNFTVHQEWLVRIVDTIQTFSRFAGLSRASAASEFAERFKYIVISSSLLSSSLPLSTLNRIATPTTPGHFDQYKPSIPSTTSTIHPTVSSMVPQFFVLLLACLVPAAMGQSYLLGFLLLGVVKILSDRGIGVPGVAKSNPNETWTMTLTVLESLVAANNTWDTVVSEAFAVLDSEEQSSFPPSASTSPLSSFRITLSSSLNVTQSQCDNVRQLLAALTSPLVLSQLSHMYAPPSPTRRSASPLGTRPNSLGQGPPSPAHSRLPSPSIPSDESYSRARADKRSTWTSSNWNHASGPLTPQLGRRSRLSTSVLAMSFEPPTSPTLRALPESIPSSVNPAAMEDDTSDADAEDEPFGVAALNLRRKRRNAHVLVSDMSTPSTNSPVLASSGASSLRVSPPQSSPSPLTSSFGSRFTSLNAVPHAPRPIHPLSMSNLHLALQGAVGSKRFVCAHLLALRFPDPPDAQSRTSLGSDVGSDMEGEDETYWEDVRSVISVLTSTLEDASSRLVEALADTTRRQEQERVALSEEEPYASSASSLRVESDHSSGTLAPICFAPMPSHLTRFATHVGAITSALEDAREHLRQCVASLQEDGEYDARSGGVTDPGLSLSPSSSAIQSYERVRRELGFALRECERGGRTLRDAVEQWTRRRPEGLAAEDGEESSIRHEEQLSSGESDKTLFNQDEAQEAHKYPIDGEQEQELLRSQLSLPSSLSMAVTAASTVRDGDGGGGGDGDDDATTHLLQMASSEHLPPPGIEQVFESASVAAAPFLRERSKLTREERIRLVKARRQSQQQQPPPGSGGEDDATMEPVPVPVLREGWGPSGEVVEELKDVIRKVSEQRRKMVERSATSLGLHPDHDVRVPPPSGIT